MNTDRIDIKPNILIGKPVIKGTRIPVYLILNLLAHGYDFDRLIQAYPKLTKDDIRAALEYAEHQAKYEEVLTTKIQYDKVPA